MNSNLNPLYEAGEYSRMANFIYDNPVVAKGTNFRHIDPTKMSRSEYRSKIAAEMKKDRNKIPPDRRQRERKKLRNFLSDEKQQQEEINYYKNKK